MPRSRAIRALKRLRFNPPLETRSCTDAFFRRGVPLPAVSSFRSLAGRMVLPSVRPAALMGFNPFAVLLPRRVRRHLCRPGPTCRSRRSPAPIDFRRGDSSRPVGIATEPVWTKRVGDVWRSTSGLRSRLRSAPAVLMAEGRDPALGFASCRVMGAGLRIRPGSTPDRIISRRAHASSLTRAAPSALELR